MQFAAGIEAGYQLLPADHPSIPQFLGAPGCKEVTSTPASPRRLSYQETFCHANTMLNNLSPRTSEEHHRLRHWQRQLEQFSPELLAHYALYEELSTPTLSTPTFNTVCLTYDQIIGRFSAQRPLTFRFGPDPYQVGYFDNPGIGKCRTNPMPFEQVETAQEHIYQSLGNLASTFNLRAFVLSWQFNISAYNSEGKPYLGDPSLHIEPYQLAAAGLSHSLTQGAHGYRTSWPLSIGAYRDCSVRVAPGRAEHRASTDCSLTSVAKAMRDGLEYAFAKATPREAEVIDIRQMFRLQRQPTFSRTSREDLCLYRMLQCAYQDGRGRVKLQDSLSLRNKYALPALHALLGKPSGHCTADEASYFLKQLLYECVMSKEGILSCTPHRFEFMLDFLFDTEKGNITPKDIAYINLGLCKIKILGNTTALEHIVEQPPATQKPQWLSAADKPQPGQQHFG